MDQEMNLDGAVCSLSPDPPGTAAGRRSRRSFLKLGLGVLSTVALLEFGSAGLLFLRSRSLEGEFGGVVTAGLVADFPPNSVTEISDNHFFVIRAPEGGFLAVHSRCTHLGCTVNWVPAEHRFVCPCHAATFDFYGDFQNPPVPRPLDTFAVEIDDGKVLVDTSRPRRREAFNPDQFVYAPPSQPAESSRNLLRGDSALLGG